MLLCKHHSQGALPLFNPIPQLAVFFVAITLMSLPVVAVTSAPMAAFALLKLGHILGMLKKDEA